MSSKESSTIKAHSPRRLLLAAEASAPAELLLNSSTPQAAAAAAHSLTLLYFHLQLTASLPVRNSSHTQDLEKKAKKFKKIDENLVGLINLESYDLVVVDNDRGLDFDFEMI